jgi:hypothetical protein
MRREDKRSVRKNFTLDDRSTLISSPLQPLTGRNEALGVVLLFGCTSAAVHDTQGQ